MRYLRNFEGIRPATREKVRQALEQLDYRPNPIARALRTNTGNRILLFLHEISEAGPSSIALAATTRAREFGFIVEVIPLESTDAAAIRSIVDTVDQAYTAGVLAFAPTPALEELFSLIRFTAPVLVERNGNGFDADTLHDDVEPAMDLLVAHLHHLGHRRLFLINGPEQWYSAQRRREGARRAAKNLGLEIVGEEFGDWSARSGSEIAAGDLRDATAVIAANDEMAIGAISSLAARGFRVPSDISIVGFDDIRLAAYTNPPLTTIRIDFSASGRLAIDRLLSLISPDVPRGVGEAIGRAFVPRQSSGPAASDHP